jgi:N6-L-threonylcarbamoyladenine synthase
VLLPGKTSGGLERLSRPLLSNIAASFQQAVVDVLIRKTMLAVARTGVQTVVLGGGVAANKTLRTQLEAACGARHVSFHAALWAYCTDNAAMIAGLGYHQLIAGDVAGFDLDAHAHSGDKMRAGS